MKLASFDIFDTTLIRKCGRPGNVFYLVARRLFPEDRAAREEFLLWRKSAEVTARKNNPGVDVTLDMIYAGAHGAEVEKEIESENLMANPEVRSIIEKKRSSGYTICFISDMYLDSAFLTDVLKREGCLKGDERVYVSCEHNARKSSGSLYEAVSKEYKAEKWCHWGDNVFSDVKIAKKNGIEAHWVNSSFTEVEKLVLKRSGQHEFAYEMSVLAGLSRAARISKGNDGYAEIAADFIAPAYIPYVSFILNDARKNGIKRLYFLSRDSHILMKLAETRQTEYSEIEFRYLFVSRKSLLLPYLKNADRESFLAVQDHNTILRMDVNKLLASLGTDRIALKEKFGISFEYDRIYTNKEEEDFLHKILGENSPYLPELKSTIASQREKLLEYFRQEKLFDGEKSAMVDVGWLGTSRLMINDILRSEGGTAVDFYYYGVRNDVYPSRYGVYSSFYRPEQMTTEITALVENYFSASPYPSTLGYSVEPDGVKPVFKSGEAYHDGKIVRCNREVAQWMCSQISGMGLEFSSVYWDWAKISMDAIAGLNVNVNLSAFVSSADFDEASFVKKLSMAELFKLVVLGKHITAFDRASLKLTCGVSLYRNLWKLHELSGRLRRFLYLKFVK